MEQTPSDSRYGLNVSRLTADYRDFIVLAGFENFGWRARMIPPPGVPGNGRGYVGRELAAVDLDGLADKMDEMRAGVQSANAMLRDGAPDDGALRGSADYPMQSRGDS
jgi:hypothetical protein